MHSQWLHAAKSRLFLHVVRVATDDNIADLPSRRDFGFLKHIGAIEVPPVLDSVFRRADAWEVLQERWCL